MNKILFPVAAAAILLSATSCSYDKTGTSFEVVDANEDESVNPAHIRGYHTEAPGMGGFPGTPNKYYPLSTRTLPADVRQQVEGNLAVRMVTVYYSPSTTLVDLAEELNPSGSQEGGTINSPADTGSGGGQAEEGDSGNGNTGSGNGTSGSDTGNTGNGSGTTTGTESGNDQN